MIDFHTDETVTDIVQRHINGVMALEDDEAKKLIKKYKAIRYELRDRLDTIHATSGRDSFTAQRLRGVIVQVEAAIQAMSGSLKDGINEASKTIALKGVNDVISETNEFNREFSGAVIPININRVAVSLESENFLINKYESSIDSYSSDLRAQLVSSISNAAIEEISYPELVQRISQFFIAEEWKIHRIARTELHTVYNLGKYNGLVDIKDKFLPDLKKTLIHRIDTRTGDDSKKAKSLNLIVDIDKPFEYTYNKVKRTFMIPPDRPNDRSVMVPYREEWID